MARSLRSLYGLWWNKLQAEGKGRQSTEDGRVKRAMEGGRLNGETEKRGIGERTVIQSDSRAVGETVGATLMTQPTHRDRTAVNSNR